MIMWVKVKHTISYENILWFVILEDKCMYHYIFIYHIFTYTNFDFIKKYTDIVYFIVLSLTTTVGYYRLV